MRQRLAWRLWFVAWLWCALAAAQVAAPPSAGGASPAEVERAKESFRVGAAAYAAGEYLAAIAALDSAYAVAPLPAIAFSLAQAERRQYFVDRKPEHLQRSVALFRRYLEQVPSGGRRADAVEALAQLEPIVAAPPASAPSAAAPAPAEARASSTRLLVIAEAPGARVWIDGVEVRGALVAEVAPGKHKVSVRAPGFHDAEREVVAVPGELIPVSMTLAELPGVVEVDAPTAAEIFVDGAFARLGGSNVQLQLASGTHRISAAQNGYRVSSRWVDVTRGSKQDISFTLEPTSQRMTSHVLMIGGAAALGAGAFVGVLAIQSEDAAQSFLDKRETQNVSDAERVRYQADVQRRDRYRMLAAVGFATSLGMLVTGLFLHELDQPRVDEMGPDIELRADVGPEHAVAGVGGTF